MRFVKPIAGISICVSLALVFLYSAYSKLWPVIETFEFSFVDTGVANWYTAPVIARVFIALELFTGGLLLIGYNLKRFTLPLTAGLLVLLSIYLVISIIVSGNQGNCGCFGEHIRMSPVQALFKNFVMLCFTAAAWFMFGGWKSRYNALLLSLAAASSLALPFIVNPVDYSYTSNNLEEKVNYPLDLEPLYHPGDSERVEVPKLELRKGKQVLAFLSLSCQHCRIAAKKFRLIKKNNPSLPIYFVLNGTPEKYREFIEDTRATNIPSSFCFGKTFVQLASAQLPRIYYLDNTKVVKKVDYYELSQYDIEDWINGDKTQDTH